MKVDIWNKYVCHSSPTEPDGQSEAKGEHHQPKNVEYLFHQEPYRR